MPLTGRGGQRPSLGKKSWHPIRTTVASIDMLAPYFHHTLLHFPVVLLIVGAAGLVLGVLFGGPLLIRIGGWSLLVGIVAGIVAGIAGLLSMDEATARGVSEASALEHRNLAIAALAVAGLAFAMWLAGRPRGGTSSVHRLSVLSPGLAIAAAGLVAWAAHLGGTMMHPRLQLKRVLGFADRGATPALSSEEAGPVLTFASQVERGARVFSAHCAECHGTEGQGGELAPALVGPGVLAGHDEEYESALDLLEFVTSEMPITDPGSLTLDEYLAVTAWMLDENGLEPVLDRSSASSIEIAKTR